ncbi:MAG: hypothetical protein ACYTGN_15315 [Planctomycetota bacterium]
MRHLLLAFVVVAFAAVPAQADLILTMNDLDNGTSVDITIVDNDALDENGLIGAVSYSGLLGEFEIQLTTGVSKPLIGDASTAELLLTNLSISTDADGGTLQLMLTDTDFVVVLAPSTLDMTGTMSGTVINGFVSGEAHVDFDNAHFGDGTPLVATTGPNSGFNFSESFGISDVAYDGSPFSMTKIMNITLNSWGVADVSFDHHVTVHNGVILPPPTIPEPAFGFLALVAAGFIAVRRRRA